jgi:uncharacterized protein (DUF4415 family)
MSEGTAVGFDPAESERKKESDWESLDPVPREGLDDARVALPWSREELAAAEFLMPSEESKVPLTIRLDSEIVDFFKSDGPGYQTRINAVLLGYVRSKRMDWQEEDAE